MTVIVPHCPEQHFHRRLEKNLKTGNFEFVYEECKIHHSDNTKYRKHDPSASWNLPK
jgi:hypothetical protein